MKLFKKHLLIIMINLLAVSFIFAEDQSGDQKKKAGFSIVPDHIVDISFDTGMAVYVGDFYRHLIRDGANVFSPALDIAISLFIIKYMGIQLSLGSGSVIHPKSRPIEGTILYMGIEPFLQYDWKYAFVKMYAGGGFQHTTMSLQWYSSAYFECGGYLGIRITDWFYITTCVKYRIGFLHSVIIKFEYDLKNNDTLSSVTFSAGLSFRIKNPYKKD